VQREVENKERRRKMKKLMVTMFTAFALAGSAHADVSKVNTCVVADPTGTPLNVRNRPNGTILGALHNDTRVIILDAALVSGKIWSKIVPVEAGKVGWVFYSFLDCT
jgi:hypothetical protein